MPNLYDHNDNEISFSQKAMSTQNQIAILTRRLNDIERKFDELIKLAKDEMTRRNDDV